MPSEKNAVAIKFRGFTFVELLVIILVLTILLGIAIPLYLAAVKNSSVRTVKANLKIIAGAAQNYKVKRNTYPGSMAVLTADGDLTQTPSGPNGVTYTLTSTDSTCVVNATENGQDAFYDGGTGSTGTYNPQSGLFADLEAP